MIEEIDKGMDQLKEQYIEPYVNQRKSSKGEIKNEDQNKLTLFPRLFRWRRFADDQRDADKHCFEEE